MTKRFKHKDIIGKIMLSFIGLFVLIIIVSAFIPAPMGNDYAKRSEEIVALNFAGTVAMTLGTYYANIDSSGFIGLTIGYEGSMLNFDNIHLQAPKDYKCEILDSIVVVTHMDGAKGEVRWR